MKRIFFATMLIIATPPLLLCQVTNQRNSKSNNQKQQTSQAEEELIKIERDWHRALERADIDALDRILAPDWKITNGSGLIFLRAGVPKDLKSGGTRFISSVPSDMKVSVYGCAAVVTKVSTDKTMYGDSPGGGKAQMTDMFVKINGRWKCVATQASRSLDSDHK